MMVTITTEVEVYLDKFDDEELLKEIEKRELKGAANTDLDQALALYKRNDDEFVIYLERYLTRINVGFKDMARMLGVEK